MNAKGKTTLEDDDDHMNRLLPLVMLATMLSACTPTVRVEAPKDPIEINLNVRIQHEIRVQVDKELETLFEEDEDLF